MRRSVSWKWARGLAAAALVAGAAVVGGPAREVSAAAVVNATMNISGGTLESGRWVHTVDQAGCTAPTFMFDIQVSNAPVHNAAIEIELHGFAFTNAVEGLVGWAGGVSTISASYDWTGPTYGTHILRAYPTAGPGHTIPAGSTLVGRSIRLCANPHTPWNFPGEVTFRFVGIDGDTGDPISIPINTVPTWSRSSAGEGLWVTRRGMYPWVHAGNPGFRLDYFVRFDPCRGPNSDPTFCNPYLGVVTQSFTGPLAGSAVFLDWELREPNDSGPFTMPDWFPEPPTGDLDDPFAPDGTEPGDFSNFLALSPGDPMPPTVDIPLNMWPQGVCVSELGHPIPPPSHALRPPAGTTRTCGGAKSYGWRLSIWVPEPPPATSHTYTLSHSQVRDLNWDGTFTPDPFSSDSGPSASYTILTNPTIRGSVNHLEPKYGCTLGGAMDISGMPTGTFPWLSRCHPAEPNVNLGTSAIRFSFNGGFADNLTIVDQIPPGFVLKNATNGSLSTFPGESPWVRYYHPGPCTLNTPRSDPGWVPATSWALPIEDARCIMWHTPGTANNVEYPSMEVNYQRDPNVNPFVLPTTLYPGIRGEESNDPGDCFANPTGIYGPVAATNPAATGSWQPLGTSPGGAGVHCVRWIIPNPYHSSQGPGQHPSPEMTVTVFHVTPNGTAAAFDPGESAYGRNAMWVYSDNMANPAPWPSYDGSTLGWPTPSRDGTVWLGNWNQTIFTASVTNTTGGSPPAAPPVGSTVTVDFHSRAWHHTGLNNMAQDWSILARIPNGFLIDDTFDPGGPDGLDGVEMIHSPRTILSDTLGTPLPYTCQILPDGDPFPGGAFVHCRADGTTMDNGVQDANASYGWRVRVRAYRMPGFTSGTWITRSWNSLDDDWNGNLDPINPLTSSPFATLTNDPTYGLVDINGAPYYVRNYNYIAPTGRDYRASAFHTMGITSLPQYQVVKEFHDPANQVPPWPGGQIDYRVSLRHQSLTNPDLTGVHVYDFLGRNPLTGVLEGDVAPLFLGVADDDPLDDTAWTFRYWCDAAEDATPTAAEAHTYTWEPSPTSGTCTGPSSVLGIRATPTAVHLGAPGSYPLYFEEWDPGDVVDLSTLRQDGFIVSVTVPLSAEAGDRVVNQAAALADQIASPFGSGSGASTTEVDEIEAIDDDLGVHTEGVTLTSQDILGNDVFEASGPDLSSVTIVSGPTGGVVSVNPDGTINWELPWAVGVWTFTYEVCNLNPEPRCDTAVVTVRTTQDLTTTTTTTTEPTTSTSSTSTTSTSSSSTSSSTTSEPPTTEPPPVPVEELLDDHDLEVRKTVDVQLGSVGATFTYQLTWYNHGPAAASDVVVHDVLPAGLELLWADDRCHVEGQTVSCPVPGVVTAGQSGTFTLAARALSAGEYLNTAIIESSTGDREPANDQDQVSVTASDWRLPLTGARLTLWWWLASALSAVGIGLVAAVRRPSPEHR